jgi:hypothetical protein
MGKDESAQILGNRSNNEHIYEPILKPRLEKDYKTMI